MTSILLKKQALIHQISRLQQKLALSNCLAKKEAFLQISLQKGFFSVRQLPIFAIDYRRRLTA